MARWVLATLDHSHRAGCTDENAPNFDASATIDDGTCQADGGNSPQTEPRMVASGRW